MNGQKIIIIQAGSQNLRIGRASDFNNPQVMLHAIGRKRSSTNKNAQKYQDGLVPPLSEEALADFEENRRQVALSLQTHLPGTGNNAKRLRVATPPQQISTFNKRSVPEEIPLSDNEFHKLCEGNNECLFDEQLLQLDAEQAKDYNIHFPFRRGEFNLHAHVSGSMSAVLQDLESIWLHALKTRLGIAAANLSQYGAVLVIPDIYNRSHLREMVNLLLQRLRFRACFLIQDSVAATFGAGLGYACVVDIGDAKCAISCVEDGISQASTRIRLGYGGADITQVFATLLKNCSFPYKTCNMQSSLRDAALIQQLKEQYCHLKLEICGAQERMFELTDQKKRLRYIIQMGDECIVAPLALFHTEMFNITGLPKLARIQLSSSQQPDVEDVFDADYIRETGRRGRDVILDATGQQCPITGDAAEDEVVIDNYETDRDALTGKISEKEDTSTAGLYLPNGQIISLEQAIVRSIERCCSEEFKRKMYSCILLAGGGTKLPGFGKMLEQKLRLYMALSHPQTSFEVNVFSKEMDPSTMQWRGAAVMACLESAPELWIQAGEWEKCGLRILREKAPFIW